MVEVQELINLQEQLAKLIKNFMSNTKKSGKLTAGFIETRVSLLEKYWTQFEENHLHITIQSDTGASNISSYIKGDIFSDIEMTYSITRGELIDLKTEQIPNSTRNESTSASSANTPPIKSDFKLPRITLPQFSGDYQLWTSFRDLFTSLVHNERSISTAQKLQYLKSNLSGEAAQLLRNIQVTDANYASAWETLNKRYQNTRAIANFYLKTLVSQTVLIGESSARLKGHLDTTSESLNALRNLGLPTDQWDAIVVYLTVQKLDPKSRELWEQSLNGNNDLPTFDQLTEFMEGRFRTLEILESEQQATKIKQTRSIAAISNHERKTFGNRTNTFHVAPNKPNKSRKCPCNHTTDSIHPLYMCTLFKGLPISERCEIVRKYGFCFNCLSSKHDKSTCLSTHKCNICNEQHHSLLHDTRHTTSSTTSSIELPESTQQPRNSQSIITSCHTKLFPTKMKTVLLATALINVESSTGVIHTFRALLDQGSQASFITGQVAQILKLKRTPVLITINGLGSSTSATARSIVQLQFSSVYKPSVMFQTDALVLNTITGLSPSTKIQRHNWPHLEGLMMADPKFSISSKIDILLGADIYSQIIMAGIRKGHSSDPIAQQTSLGWIISGQISSSNHLSQTSVTTCHTQLDLNDQLRKFWEIEEVDIIRKNTKEEQECEMHYQQTHSRSADGLYTVQLPFNNYPPLFGSSRDNALKQLYQIEKRFASNAKLYEQYKQFMQEYIELGHMIKSAPAQSCNTGQSLNTKPVYNSFYLPHHAVLKESSTTTKLRVVFDGPRKSANNKSLNELLRVGPRLQQDLWYILLRWRKHKIAFSADIQKMYRQIKVSTDHTEFQRIVWRNSISEPVHDYRLLTVTYGTTSAPYLAIKTVQQLSSDERDQFPAASTMAMNDFYVDDLLSGADSVDEALILQQDVIRLLSSGGFELKKWSSNCTQLINAIPENYRESSLEKNIQHDYNIKTLGVNWSPLSDNFQFKINLPSKTNRTTKRNLLSDVAKLFDPLGWLAPTIILAKIMFQTLWLEGIGWDDDLPEELNIQWNEFRENLPAVTTIPIPRWIGTRKTGTTFELHGFSDASIKAFAAVVYSRTICENGKCQISLLAAKTRVAPLKQITLPRLELCGAVLLAKLIQKIRSAMMIEDLTTRAYTDSTIVLSWLNGHPNKWKTFIGNRVTTIHEVLTPNQWYHVRSEDNPADCATRGINPNYLRDHKLWWNGPDWLKKPRHSWPNIKPFRKEETDLELKTVCLSTTISDTTTTEWLHKYSTLTKLIRVTAYCRRFIHNAKKSTSKFTGYLTAQELIQARNNWISIVQQQAYGTEIERIKAGKIIGNKSSLLSLNPIISDRGILRVGGRLEHSTLSTASKHPIILPSSSYLSTLVILKAHHDTLHGGTQATSCFVRQLYWIPNARSAIRRIIHRCVKCHRYSAATKKQLMANLPKSRVTPSKVFSHTGVDFAGPFSLRMSKHRGKGTIKGYVAMFVCFATKAIHIELVSDLTSQAFLAAFRRFVSRRGLCTDIYSDCGTNFVGAQKELNILNQQLSTECGAVLANDGITWHFIPPGSPHFGGLWEASVKSLKYHLRRVLNPAILTFEEFTTLLTQIESSLNSRPLTTISNDTNDEDILTPGHFLIGGPLNAVPEPSLLHIRENRLTRWQLVQKMHQDLWKRWSNDYLAGLQQRPRKWSRQQSNVQIGNVVLLKDENLPPAKWALARVEQVHPGKDSLVRVCTLRYNGHLIKRPIVKICPLPIRDNDNHQSQSS